MIDQDTLAKKIHDPGLRQIAIDRSRERVSVIIVIDFPKPRLEIGEVISGPTITSFPTSVEPESPEELRELDRRNASVRNFLENMLESPPHWLPLARSFVATVDGIQLQKIAKSPLTKSIQLNRDLDTPAYEEIK